MSEERKLRPEMVERFRMIRATLPHWGGGTHKPTPEADAKLTSNIGESIARVMAGREAPEKHTVKAMHCEVCGAKERLEGKRTVIEHDLAKHPQGEIPGSQRELKPVKRTREHDDDERIFGDGDRTRETYNERLQAGRKLLGRGDQ